VKLSALADQRFDPDPDISGITPDSRAVREGFLFAALPGAKADGSAFIPQAEERGAAAVLAKPGVRTRLPLVADEEPRQRLSQIAARFHPRQPDFVAGVTGTNGKTSTAVFAASLWSMLGDKAGSIGTLGARAPGFDRPLDHTTPEPVTLHETLDAMAGEGVSHLAMEVSSHALAQYRADGVRFSAAAFTNLTQDHLDFHGTMEAYFEAKLRLFLDLLPATGVAVVNMDGARSADVAATAHRRGARVITSGRRGETLHIRALEPKPAGLDLEVEARGHIYRLSLPLIGAFQAENALLAAGIVLASDRPTAEVLPLLERLPGVPGRMQFAAKARGAGIFIDYAHTPDAVATALRAIRPHAEGRVIAIVGAGGDRDRAKRPLMGKAAAAGADIVIVTDDNPRSEDPAAIRCEVMEGCPDAHNIGGRADAIAAGVSLLQSGDVLLIAGKGHETGQTIGGITHPFDDLAEARRAAATVGGGR
jgi:UDP-N-acetylmuramoyl-L-alanyl-D-glutamate--2,6-diaminopimelate ligase